MYEQITSLPAIEFHDWSMPLYFSQAIIKPSNSQFSFTCSYFHGIRLNHIQVALHIFFSGAIT